MSVLQTTRAARRRLCALALAAAAFASGACDSDTAGVGADNALPADSGLATADSAATATPSDSVTRVAPVDPGAVDPSDSATSAGDSASTVPAAPAPESSVPLLEAATSLPGIVYGSNLMEASLLNSVNTGTVLGGGVSEQNIGSLLATVRAKRGRIVLRLYRGRDSYVQNADGTFSLTKWKALVSRFRNSNLAPYISDGTILGHYLIDEPQRSERWGGKAISQATVEEMARYSKSIWPTLTTMARTVPSWLAQSSITYRYLDAGWAQYASGKGNVTTYVTTEVSAARRKGLGLVVGLNVLDGGNGSSRIPGWSRGKWAMSASEIRTYSTVLLGQTYACGFTNWMYDQKYYARSDIRSAMADMSAKAGAHPKTSCRQ